MYNRVLETGRWIRDDIFQWNNGEWVRSDFFQWDNERLDLFRWFTFLTFSIFILYKYISWIVVTIITLELALFPMVCICAFALVLSLFLIRFLPNYLASPFQYNENQEVQQNNENQEAQQNIRRGRIFLAILVEFTICFLMLLFLIFTNPILVSIKGLILCGFIGFGIIGFLAIFYFMRNAAEANAQEDGIDWRKWIGIILCSSFSAIMTSALIHPLSSIFNEFEDHSGDVSWIELSEYVISSSMLFDMITLGIGSFTLAFYAIINSEAANENNSWLKFAISIGTTLHILNIMRIHITGLSKKREKK